MQETLVRLSKVSLTEAFSRLHIACLRQSSSPQKTFRVFRGPHPHFCVLSKVSLTEAFSRLHIACLRQSSSPQKTFRVFRGPHPHFCVLSKVSLTEAFSRLHIACLRQSSSPQKTFRVFRGPHPHFCVLSKVSLTEAFSRLHIACLRQSSSPQKAFRVFRAPIHTCVCCRRSHSLKPKFINQKAFEDYFLKRFLFYLYNFICHCNIFAYVRYQDYRLCKSIFFYFFQRN